jgi:uncharacterized protein YjbK
VSTAYKSPVHRGDQEVEFKFRVDREEDFVAIARAAGAELTAPVTQENHFFDTAERALEQGRFVLRLRDESGRYLLTAKGPRDPASTDTLSAKLETEVELDPSTATEILSGTRSPLETLAGLASSPLVNELRATVKDRPLERIGSFRNERIRLPLHLGQPVTLELDRTTFPGGVVHHEVEVEVPPGVDAAALEAALLELFAKAGVSVRSAPSKARRFFLALAKKQIS